MSSVTSSHLTRENPYVMNTIQVEVVSAEESIFSGAAEFVVLPGEVGELGVYPNHTPLITRRDELIFVAGGILEIQPNLVTVLADTAIRGTDLDEARANEARRAAEEALTNAKSKMDLTRAHSELAAVTAQIQTIRRYRSR